MWSKTYSGGLVEIEALLAVWQSTVNIHQGRVCVCVHSSPQPAAVCAGLPFGKPGMSHATNTRFNCFDS